MTQSLNDNLSVVWRHERAVWIPGMARHDSGEASRGQVRKDLGCHMGGRMAKQRHGYGSDLDVKRAWWKGRCHEIEADE